jgi:hypothetical protein
VLDDWYRQANSNVVAGKQGVAMRLFGLAALLAPVVGLTLVSLTGRILRRRALRRGDVTARLTAEPKSRPLFVKQRLPV